MDACYFSEFDAFLHQIPCTEMSKNSGEERMQRIAMDKLDAAVRTKAL